MKSDWQRLHPLTPLLRSWAVIGAVVLGAVRDFRGDLTADRLLLGVAVLIPTALVYGFLSWRFTRYRVSLEELHLETGLLIRRDRRLRLDRMQSVEVVRPLPARLTGLAALKLDLAGDDDTGSTLRYLSIGHAQHLRAELLARAAGIAPESGEAPERPLATVPEGRLLGSIALSAAPWGSLLLGVGFALPFLLTGTRAGLIGAVPFLAGVWHTTFNRFAAGFAFTVAESPDGLRISSGLLDRKHSTVPPGRVQAVRITAPLLWRSRGWVQVELNVAGDGPDVLIPVAPRAEAIALLARILPGADIDAVPLTRSPHRARWLSPAGWSRSACGADDRVFVVRHGVLRPRTDVIPHAKVQSIRLHQGPLQAAFGLASVALDSTGGPVRIRARLRDAAEAHRIVATQAERSRLGRRAALPERWMATPPPDGTPPPDAPTP